MNAGYSSGWCEASFGLELVSAEVLCRAKGDPSCRFIMAPPHRIDEHVHAYFAGRGAGAARGGAAPQPYADPGLLRAQAHGGGKLPARAPAGDGGAPAGRAAARADAEARGGRAPHRRHRARLQQPDGDRHRQRQPAREAPPRGRARGGRSSTRSPPRASAPPSSRGSSSRSAARRSSRPRCSSSTPIVAELTRMLGRVIGEEVKLVTRLDGGAGPSRPTAGSSSRSS